jgi:hypothetical protein
MSLQDAAMLPSKQRAMSSKSRLFYLQSELGKHGWRSTLLAYLYAGSSSLGFCSSGVLHRSRDIYPNTNATFCNSCLHQRS